MDEIAPEKEIRIKKNRTDPWINNEILHQTENRGKLLRRLSKHKNNVEHRQEYNRARNKLARDIETARREQFSNVAEEHKHDPRRLWQHLKATGYRQKTKETSAIVLDIDGETCHDKSKIANYFNSFFTTVAATLAKELALPYLHHHPPPPLPFFFFFFFFFFYLQQQGTAQGHNKKGEKKKKRK